MNFNYVVLKVSLYGSILSQKKELEDKIDDIVYKYAGVRGIRYDRIPMSFNEQNAIEMREQMMNELKSPQKELEYAERMINIMKPDVDEILSKFDKTTRNMIEMLFVDGKTYEDVGIKYGYTSSAIWKKIRREIEKV